MPRVSKLSLAPLDWGEESIGQRVARIRNERGFTQVEFSGTIGIVQTLITDYETDRLRLTAGVAIRFAMALDVSLNELVHPNTANSASRKPSRKVLRRLERIEVRPPTQETTRIRTIATFLEVAALKTAGRAQSPRKKETTWTDKKPTSYWISSARRSLQQSPNCSKY